MKKLRNPFKSLNKFDWALWLFSLVGVTMSFILVQSPDWWTLATSLIGVTALIFAAKGDPFGLIIMIGFSLIYSFVSFTFGYYGESLIYLCMQLPVSIASLVSWLKNPYKKGAAEVKVGKLTPKYALIIAISAILVTTAFYFILRAFNTENLIVSTISVATSFIALFLMALRVPLYSVAFMLNDIVLIVLWSLACVRSISYIPMVVCFSVFLLNDLYGFINWTKRKKRQAEESKATLTDENNPPSKN